MLIGYMRVSKNDGSQTLDLQKDALRAAGVDAATLKMAAAAMSDPKSIASEVAKRLNITTATLYSYVNSDGTLKPAGIKLVETGKTCN
jgi:hypothetical protein